MTDTLVPPKTLEERITARLHEQIGDLVTEADLKDMVARGIELALFTPRQTPRQYGGYDTQPSIVDQQVSLLLSTRMQVAVDAWLAANPEKIQQAIDVTIKAGVGAALLGALDARFAGIFDYGVQTLQGRGLLPRNPNG